MSQPLFVILPPMITAFVVRHGHVDFPLDESGRPLLYGPEALLSFRGRNQMTELGRNLNNQKANFDCLYTSPLLRGRQSAYLLSQELGNPSIAIVEGLRTSIYPSWRGRLVSEYEDAGGDIAPPGPNDETLADTYQRIWETFTGIIDESKGRNYHTIGIITHSEEVGALLHRLRNPEVNEPGIYEPPANGEALQLLISPTYGLIESQIVTTYDIPRGKERY